MATPKEVVWDPDQHTAEKLRLLRYYLDAWWTIILSSGFPEATYVDGFSGPGEYKNGADGSPAVAVRALLDHQGKDWWGKTARVVLLDQDERRVEHLSSALSRRFGELPPAVELHREHGTCGDRLLPLLDETGSWGTPIFAFLDPHGVDVPFEVVERIGRNTSSEVLVTFMSDWLRRFAKLEELEHGDRLFGNRDWRQVTDQPPSHKRRWLVDLYRQRLKEAGFAYRLAFELVDEQGHGFFLIHGTSSDRGLEKMKEAMWKVDPVRGIQFRDPRDPNQTRFDIGASSPDLRGLENLLAEKMSDRPATVDDLRRWALVDTVFLGQHVVPVLRKWRDASYDHPVLDIQPPGGHISGSKRVTLLRQPPPQPQREKGLFDLSPGN